MGQTFEGLGFKVGGWEGGVVRLVGEWVNCASEVRMRMKMRCVEWD